MRQKWRTNETFIDTKFQSLKFCLSFSLRDWEWVRNRSALRIQHSTLWVNKSKALEHDNNPLTYHVNIWSKFTQCWRSILFLNLLEFTNTRIQSWIPEPYYNSFYASLQPHKQWTICNVQRWFILGFLLFVLLFESIETIYISISKHVYRATKQKKTEVIQKYGSKVTNNNNNPDILMEEEE